MLVALLYLLLDPKYVSVIQTIKIIPLNKAFLDRQRYSDVVSLIVKVFKQNNTKQFLVADATAYYTTNDFMVMCFINIRKTFVNKFMWQLSMLQLRKEKKYWVLKLGY